MMLSGKTFHSMISIDGNTEKKVDFTSQLKNARLFEIPSEGQCLVKEFDIPNEDLQKEKILMIPACAKLPSSVAFYINCSTDPNCHDPIPDQLKNQDIPIVECSESFYWCKSIIRIPAGAKKIKINLKGKPGTVVAVSDMQIYQ